MDLDKSLTVGEMGKSLDNRFNTINVLEALYKVSNFIISDLALKILSDRAVILNGFPSDISPQSLAEDKRRLYAPPDALKPLKLAYWNLLILEKPEKAIGSINLTLSDKE